MADDLHALSASVLLMSAKKHLEGLGLRTGAWGTDLKDSQVLRGTRLMAEGRFVSQGSFLSSKFICWRKRSLGDWMAWQKLEKSEFIKKLGDFLRQLTGGSQGRSSSLWKKIEGTKSQKGKEWRMGRMKWRRAWRWSSRDQCLGTC